MYAYVGNNPLRHGPTGLSKDTAAPAAEVCDGPEIYTNSSGRTTIIIHASGEHFSRKKSDAPAPPPDDEVRFRPGGQSAVTWWDSLQRGDYVTKNRAAS